MDLTQVGVTVSLTQVGWIRLLEVRLSKMIPNLGNIVCLLISKMDVKADGNNWQINENDI